MSGDDEDLDSLIKNVFAGSEDAATAFVDQYGPWVLQVVRESLDPRMRTQFDSLDFVQDVWAAFFANPPPEGKFKRAEKLAAFLRDIAHNKVVDAARRLTSDKRAARCEHSLDDSATAESKWFIANQPTPSEEVKGQEAWEGLLAGQPIVYRRILILLREGKTAVEVAAELGIHVRTVQRLIVKLLSRPKQ
jgi:RNA polymerase sigma factor (sigma-70 family)